MTGVLTKLWRGQYSLPLAFLGFFVFGFWVALFAGAIILLLAFELRQDRLGYIVTFLLLVSYWLIASVGVWRSAASSLASDNWVSRLEAITARGLVALVAAYALWSLYDGGARWLLGRVSG